MRLVAVFAIVACAARAQFSDLGTPYDGSIVYFASGLRLKGSTEPTYGKLFVADETGVRLFRSRAEVYPPSAPTWSDGTLYSFLGADVSADGRTIAAAMEGTVAFCPGHGNRFVGTDLISSAGDRDFPCIVQLSPAGRLALALCSSSPIVLSPTSVFFLDVQTGVQTQLNLPPRTNEFDFFAPPSTGGRVIANDGTALLNYSNYGLVAQPFIARPGADIQSFPVQNADMLAISADGKSVLYVRFDLGQLRIFNLDTQEDRLVTPLQWPFGNVAMSDDTRQVLFVRAGQAYIVATDGTGLRQLTSDPTGIIEAVLSGDGKIAYATTGGTRLIKIHVDTGQQIEIIGRTPDIGGYAGIVDAGMAVTLYGGGLSDETLQGSPPLNPWLGSLTMWIEQRKVPVLAVSPSSVTFLVPWDVVPWSTVPGGTASQFRVLVETAAVHSPFDFPETYIDVSAYPRAGVIAHQNWDGLVDYGSHAPHAGEIIHVWAVGLGAVTPEVIPGTVAPSVEPLARLATPLSCDNAEVLYAGLAPGYLERVYQVDLKIGNVTGYVKFNCSIGGKDSFTFLSLNVTP